MRIEIGIDRRGDGSAQIIVKQLRFGNPSLDFTYVVEPSVWGPTGVYGGLPMEAALTYPDFDEVERLEKANARALLASVSEEFQDEDVCRTTDLLYGNPTQMLLDHADMTRADLIVVNAAHEGPALSFLTGSVARGLVIGAKQSILLARSATNASSATRPLRAVIATDHSPYMDKCIEQLIRFRPRGLQQITVLTVFPEQEMTELKALLPHLAVNPVDALWHDLEERNRDVIRRLREGLQPCPVTLSSRVSGVDVNKAIAETMKETESDLLIVGAQGHSFLQRLTMGSVSFEQAMTAPYSVLVLRNEERVVDASPASFHERYGSMLPTFAS